MLLLLAGCSSGRPFDSYMLSLSWTGDGFVVHGLWPEGPRNCAGAAFDPSAVPGELSRIMPGKLMEHEWSAHGTCSGLSQSEYFRTTLRAFRMVKIPALGRDASHREVARAFAGANEDFPNGAIVVSRDGEVRVCFTAELRPRRCAAR